MIISPPFLPTRAANQTEPAWLDTAFGLPAILPSTQAPEGSFPLGNNLVWHNGLHIQGQANGEGQTVVRAIADGEILFVYPPARANANIDDPQNYNPFDDGDGARWTDNGIAIVKHTTEIGANGNQATEIVYFSVYMHLSQIGRITPAGQNAARALQPGDRIWRKDEIGRAGQVYGHAGQVHLEIALDEANLTRLIGRAPAWVDPTNIPVPTADGRIDAVFGAIWFYLPASTPIQNATPATHLRSASQTTLGEAVWVRMHDEGGSCSFTTFNNQGRPIGNVQPETDGEYNRYNTANTRHNALPQADRNRSSPSGWYELLRFGRNLGRGPNAADKDPLPANAAHWRQITGPHGQAVWADLNAEGSYKFSDADFLPIQGWCFINDDSAPNDQRCDSNHLKNLIADPDPAVPNRMETIALARRLGDAEVMQKLRRVVCQFPSEWDQGTIAARYGFVRELPPFQAAPEAWAPLEAHLRAVSFANLPQEYTAATWQVHPRQFVELMRTCGWLSLGELGQLLPRVGVLNSVSTWRLATDRLRDTIQYSNLNHVFRKYNLTTANRQTAFLAQVYIETGCLRLLEEGGSGNPNPAIPMAQYYAAFYGRGLMQLTWAGTYADYGKFRGFANHTGTYSDNRITANSQHDWAAPTRDRQNNLIRDRRQWGPRFDPDIVATSRFNACDSGTFFWVQKHFTGTSNINRLADQGLTSELIGRMSILVNGGGNGYNERLQYAAFVERYRGDGTETTQTGTITATRQRINHGQWTTTGNAFTLHVNYTPQRPATEG